MYRILTTQELHRLGFTHEDIRFARTCCLLRLSRGTYVVRHVCTVESHRPLWSSIQEKTHDEFVEYGDSRDRINALDAAVMARFESRFQGRQQQVAAADSGDGSPSATPKQAAAEKEIVSHISAALIHGLPVAYPVTHQVEVVRPGINRRFKNLHVRGNAIPRDHVVTVGGVMVTSLERTLIDVARTYSLEISVAMLDSALRRGMTTLDALRALLPQTVEKRNKKRVELALKLADGRRESPGESIAAVRFYQYGIAGMVPQVSFAAEALGGTIRVDFCHKGARLIVEIDGLGKYYLGSGVPRTEIEKERRREQWLRDHGWRVVRISWKELFHEAKFDEIKVALMKAGGPATASAR